MKAEFKPRHNPPKAATYARVSGGYQATEDKDSLPYQTKTATVYVKEHGWELVEQIEEVVSGTKLERPGFNKLMELAAKGELDYIVLAYLSREARNFGVSVQLRAKLEGYGCRIEYVDTDTSTEQGRRFADMRRLFNEWERDEIELRLARGRQNKMEHGKIMGGGRQPLGYRYIKGQYRFEIVPEEAKYVRTIFEWFAYERITLYEAGKRLKAMGVPTKTGGKWSPSAISYILHNTMYYGVYYHNKTTAVLPEKRNQPGKVMKRDATSRVATPKEDWIAFDVPAILEGDSGRKLWDMAQETIKRNAKNSWRNAKQAYLLRTGLLVCDMCGQPMVGTSSRGKRYYQCMGKHSQRIHIQGEPRCKSKLLIADTVEKQVWDTVVALLSNPEVPFKQASEKARAEQDERDYDALAQMEANLQGLDEQLDLLIDLYTTKRITQTKFDERQTAIEQQRSGILEAKSDIMARVQSRQRVEADRETLALLGETFKHLDIEPSFQQKRDVLETVNLKVHSVGDGNVYVEGLIENNILILGSRFLQLGSLHTETRKPVPSVTFATTELGIAEDVLLWDRKTFGEDGEYERLLEKLANGNSELDTKPKSVPAADPRAATPLRYRD